MAILTKSRARKPLAENRMSVSWSNYNDEGERYNLHVSAEETERAPYGHRYSMKLSPAEAVAFCADVASFMTNDPNSGTVDRRSAVEKLRALADKLEAQGNLQRMGLTG